MSKDTDTLLRAILATVARTAFPPSDLIEIVNPTGKSAKHVTAYNLADGTRTQSQIATALKIDSGNFSRTVARWIECGVMFRIDEGKESRLLHLYPISSKPLKE